MTGKEQAKSGVGFVATKDRLLFALIALIASAAVLWCGWVTVGNATSLTRGEVKEIVKENSVDEKEASAIAKRDAPYVKDQQWIKDQIVQVQKRDTRLVEVIERNTEAIIELKVQIAKMRAKNGTN